MKTTNRLRRWLRQAADTLRSDGRGGETTRAYTLRADTFDEAARTIDAVLATEAPVEAFDVARGYVYEVLLMDGCELPARGQIPLTDTHKDFSLTDQVGSTRALRIDGDRLLGTNHLSTTPLGNVAHDLVRNGDVTDNSIRYKTLEFTTIPAGQTRNVSGRSFTAPTDRPLRVTTRWRPRANSLCPIGCDENATNRSHPDSVSGKDTPMTFEEWLRSLHFTADDLTAPETDALRALFDERGADATPLEAARALAEAEDDSRGDTAAGDAARSAPDLATDVSQAVRDAVAAERTAERARQESIRSLAGDNDPPAVQDAIRTAIDTGADVHAARQGVLEAIRAARPDVANPVGIHVTGAATTEALTAGLLIRGAVYSEDADLVAAVGEQPANEGDRFRDMPLLDICRAALRLDGAAIPAGREDTIRAAFSTVSLPKILGNTARLSMLRGYRAVRDTWSSWCSPGSVTNFQQVTRARLTETGDLVEVTPSGEVGYGSAVEEYEQFNIATYAKNTAFTRTHIINDDTGELTRQRVRDGRRARQLVAKLVYTHLLANGTMGDGNALFNQSKHDNLFTSKALNAANLGYAVQKFRQRTDKDGQPIDVEPYVLLVCPEIEEAAKLLLESDYNIDGTSTAKQGRKNIYKGTLKLEVESRLSNSTYTGHSATGYYLMANPAEADTVEVAFLNGVQTPTLTTFNAGPDRLGTIFQVLLDVGCKSLDWRTMHRQTG